MHVTNIRINVDGTVQSNEDRDINRVETLENVLHEI